jgi:hypothetical protein
MHLEVFLKLKKTLKTLSSRQIYKKTKKKTKKPGFFQPCLGAGDEGAVVVAAVVWVQTDGERWSSPHRLEEAVGWTPGGSQRWSQPG